MTNILNVRVRRLLKEDLLDYAKHFAGFMAGIAVVLLIQYLVYLIIGFDFGITLAGRELDMRELNFSGFLGAISFAGITLVMFIAGIVTSAELPTYVRMGVARKEYFVATLVAAIIVSLLLAPTLLGLNVIINLFVDAELFLYDAFLAGGGDFFVLASQALVYIALFLAGYSIAIIWQKVGWFLGLCMGFIIAIGVGFLGWNVGRIFNILNIVIGDHDNWFEVNWVASNGILAITALGLIGMFGVLTYMLLKTISVKVK